MATPRLVRATEVCFVGERLRQPGEMFEYDGPMPPKGGAIVLADEEISSPPRRERKPSKRGVPAPSWSGEGNKELGGQVAGE